MQLFSRDGVWYVECKFYDAATDRRVRRRRSTGVPDDGTRKARQRAEITGEQIARSLAAGRDRDLRAVTLKAAFEALIEARELARTPTDRTLYAAAPVLAYFGPSARAASIGPAEVVAYAAQRTAADYSAGTVRRELNELRQALKAVGFTPPRTPKLAAYKPRETWLTPEQAARLVAEVPAQYRDHVILYLQLGVRKREIYAISRVAPGRARVHGTKTSKADRVVALTAQAEAILERLDYKVPRWTNTDRDLRAAAVRAGLGRLSCNDLRRSFATQLANQGAPVLHLKELLGHTSTRMVDLVYARVSHGPHLDLTLAMLEPVPDMSQEQTARPQSPGPETPPEP